MKNVSYLDINISGGFWQEKLDMLRRATVDAVYDRFDETHRFSALECKWREGDPHEPHIYWDSDVAKWIEAAAYLIAKEPCAKWEQRIEAIIDKFIANSDENGYFNSHFLVKDQDKRFKNRIDHELYCLGHWIEAAVAYFEATGKRRFLDAVCRYADYVERVFKIEHSAAFVTPGHPELELALIRLYHASGEERYLSLAKYFIDEHGKHPEDHMWERECGWTEDYNMDLTPLVERTSIEGHCVRALYLLAGMIDVAKLTDDEKLAEACTRLFDDCTKRKMYVTGGIGSARVGESFAAPYYLPNRTSYTETCAAISLALAANRMLSIDENARYADIVERVLYNAGLSGISLDGRSFFYENPMEIDLDFNHPTTISPRSDHFPKPVRSEVFFCSCCPPNIARFIASVASFATATNDTCVFLNQYISLDSDLISVRTDYPVSGKVSVTLKDKSRTLAIRIPAWTKKFTLNAPYEMKNGYALVKDFDGTVTLDMDMPVRLVKANRRTHENTAKAAVMRGPMVYCIEGVDNGEELSSIILASDPAFRLEASELSPFPAILASAKRPTASEELYFDSEDAQYDDVTLKLIPYFTFANRGASDMRVWIPHTL